MRYLSTRRSGDAGVSFGEAVLQGIAPDGGLYVPANLSPLPAATWRAWARLPFADLARELLTPLCTAADAKDNLSATTLATICAEAWRRFDDPAVTPLRPLPHLGAAWGCEAHLLELFHGPTLAFKDVALQFLGRLFDALVAADGRRALVLGATSGDTGSAAIEGCRGRDGLDIAILHPHGRPSAIQRRQMTTVLDANVSNIAVRGTFDDCQAIVKALMVDPALRRQRRLLAVNSINVARVLAQMTYYAYAALRLGAPARSVRFCVPTGNFGDALAGAWVRALGLPIETIVIATNANDILARALASGRYAPGAVAATLSPSMDISVASNFERLLYALHGSDPAWTGKAMARLAAGGGVQLAPAALAALRAGFDAGSADDAATTAAIAATYRAEGLLIDPHTAVGVAVAAGHAQRRPELAGAPLVVLATAHPAKFPDAVEAATGVRPCLPAALAQLERAPERMVVVDADGAAVRALLGAA